MGRLVGFQGFLCGDVNRGNSTPPSLHIDSRTSSLSILLFTFFVCVSGGFCRSILFGASSPIVLLGG